MLKLIDQSKSLNGTDGKINLNKLTVSSFHMALICVPSIINVNTANNNASNVKNSNKITVAGGEKNEHCFHSFLIHCANWLTAKNIAWPDIIAI